MVDAAVLGVILLYGLGKFHPAPALPRSLDGIGVQGQRVGQVDDIARLSVLEECGVALCGNLLYLPLHGRQQHLVFAGMLVGIDHHAVTLGVHAGGVFVLVYLVVLLMRIDGIAGG